MYNLKLLWCVVEATENKNPIFATPGTRQYTQPTRLRPAPRAPINNNDWPMKKKSEPRARELELSRHIPADHIYGTVSCPQRRETGLRSSARLPLAWLMSILEKKAGDMGHSGHRLGRRFDQKSGRSGHTLVGFVRTVWSKRVSLRSRPARWV